MRFDVYCSVCAALLDTIPETDVSGWNEAILWGWLIQQQHRKAVHGKEG